MFCFFCLKNLSNGCTVALFFWLFSAGCVEIHHVTIVTVLQKIQKLVTQRTCMLRPEESLDLPALLEAVWFSDSVQTCLALCTVSNTFAGDGGAQSPCQILRYFNVLYWYLLIFLIGWAMIWWSDIWSSGYCRHVVPGRRYGIGALGTPELRWSVICVFFQQPTDWHFCVSNRVNAVPSSPGR